MEQPNARILVTGGAGYVGSHVCKALHRAGFSPVAFDNLSRGFRWTVKWGPLVEGDVRDRMAIEGALRAYQPAAVVHMAAYAYVGESVTDPWLYYENNIGGALSLLAAMRTAGLRKFVFSSSCNVYGAIDDRAIRENDAKDPPNPYGWTKLMIEQMLADLAAVDEIDFVSLRYFNAAGADPEGEIGEAHDPETHIIPLVLQAAAGKRRGVSIFGDDYPTPDGTCIRDFVHVSDLADAHVLAVRHLLSGRPSDAFNLGSETGTSVREIVETAQAVTGRPVAAKVDNRRKGDLYRLVGDPARAKKVLGWTPNFTDVRDQIAHAWSWMATGKSTER